MYNCDIIQDDNSVINSDMDSDANHEINESFNNERVSQSELNSISSQSSDSVITLSDFDGILAPLKEKLNAVENMNIELRELFENKNREFRELFEDYVENTDRKLATADRKLKNIKAFIIIILWVLFVLFAIYANNLTKANIEVEVNASDPYINEKYFKQYENQLQKYETDLNNIKTELDNNKQWLRILEYKLEFTENIVNNSNSREDEQSNQSIPIKTNTNLSIATTTTLSYIAVPIILITIITIIFSKLYGIGRSAEIISLRLSNAEHFSRTTKRDLEYTKRELNARFESISLANNEIVDPLVHQWAIIDAENNELINKISNFEQSMASNITSLNELIANTKMEIKGEYNKELDAIKDGVENTKSELNNTKLAVENAKQEVSARFDSISLTNNQLMDTTRTELETNKTQMSQLTKKTDELFTTGTITYTELLDRIENIRSELNNAKLMLIKEITNSTPPGIVAFFACETAPDGWLKANAQSVSRTTYADLFARIGTRFGSGDGSTTFALPDIRGEFIRGYDDGRGVDKGRTLGSFQWGSSIPMAGIIDDDNLRVYSSSNHSLWEFAGQTFDDGFESDVGSGELRNGITFPNDDVGNKVWSGGMNNFRLGSITSWNILKGTRPRSIAFLACIKY